MKRLVYRCACKNQGDYRWAEPEFTAFVLRGFVAGTDSRECLVCHRQQVMIRRQISKMSDWFTVCRGMGRQLKRSCHLVPVKSSGQSSAPALGDAGSR
jgi:hypothetical protein